MFGFTTGPSSWLPDGGRTANDTVAEQTGTKGSWLERYRALIRLRRDRAELRSERVEWLDTEATDLVSFRRGAIIVVVNAGKETVSFSSGGEVVFDSFHQFTGTMGPVELLPDQAVVLVDVDRAARGDVALQRE